MFFAISVIVSAIGTILFLVAWTLNRFMKPRPSVDAVIFVAGFIGIVLAVLGLVSTLVSTIVNRDWLILFGMIAAFVAGSLMLKPDNKEDVNTV